jgi:hypothetical protein
MRTAHYAEKINILQLRKCVPSWIATGDGLPAASVLLLGLDSKSDCSWGLGQDASAQCARLLHPGTSFFCNPLPHDGISSNSSTLDRSVIKTAETTDC